MSTPVRKVGTFPSARVPSTSGGLPVEVSLIAQLGHGAGDRFFAESLVRQRGHESFVDEMDEPSARLGGVDFPRGDASSLYSFAVGAKGHPFHRHAGHRVFTAIAGSAGTQLRFSSATREQIDADPQNFIRALHQINIPPDCLFTVRFGGDTWHQFASLSKGERHPAFFALSCHTNELGGDMPDALREKVLANEASIPALTELLPPHVEASLRAAPIDLQRVPTVQLSLDAPPGSWHAGFCRIVRRTAGVLRSAWSTRHAHGGFHARRSVVELDGVPTDSLLARQLIDADHEDMFRLVLTGQNVGEGNAATLLSRLLDGFLENPPASVSRMMMLRNIIARPIGLRTSPLGCPVSSLLSTCTEMLFEQRHPVLAQSIDADGQRAQVILGADDRHLVFRSCVGIQILDRWTLEITLGTRVRYSNLFGRLYMALIDRTHRAHVSPTMLRMAAEHAFQQPATSHVARSPHSLFSIPVAH
ncbi:DUF2867 domain-containing protein [Rhodanobacter sp. L36]|uniref:DUF2867 domain-containing protein n=1 Tax=Rhodanobacter sp. L36 TaxID=1747221 RepID=UPI00131E19CF|nr:DUF2867 domain-containing protein [Rhodanobacter sp. L36]